jgi:hypothetical protein
LRGFGVFAPQGWCRMNLAKIKDLIEQYEAITLWEQ